MSRSGETKIVKSGGFFCQGGLELPKPADTFARLLGGAAGPSALFALGASLSDRRIAGNVGESLAMVGFKLVVHPAIVWLLAVYVFSLDPLWVAVATVTAALPIGANVFIVAQKYDRYVARTTSATLISTALSMVTVAVLLEALTPL